MDGFSRQSHPAEVDWPGNGEMILAAVNEAPESGTPPKGLAQCPSEPLRCGVEKLAGDSPGGDERSRGPGTTEPDAPKLVASVQMVADQFTAVHDGLTVLDHQRRLKPDPGAGGVTLQGVIRFFVHVAEEMGEARLLQIEGSTHGGGAIGISGDVVARAGVGLIEAGEASIRTQFRKANDYGFRMVFEHSPKFQEEVVLHRMAVVVEAQDDVAASGAQKTISGKNRTFDDRILEEPDSREPASQQGEGVVAASIGANEDFIGRWGQGQEFGASNGQVETPVAGRDYDREGHAAKPRMEETRRRP